MEFSHDITIAAESMGRERGVKIKNTEERVAGDSVWILMFAKIGNSRRIST